MILGASYNTVLDDRYYDIIKDTNLDYIKTRLRWSSVLSVIGNKYDWSAYDKMVSRCKDKNINLWLEVGLGFINANPKLKDGKPIDPNVIGKSEYIKHISRFVKICLDRYGDEINVWGIDSELNAAFLSGVFGWRTFPSISKISNVWRDPVFLDDIVYKISDVIRSYDKLTFTQFHTDIPDGVYKELNLPTLFDSIKRWENRLDIIGLSAYPFYYDADLTNVYPNLYDRFSKIRDITSKPIILIESGCSVAKDVTGYHKRYQFTEDVQSDYVNIMAELVDTVIDGMFYFKVKPTEGFKLPRQPNSKDLYIFQVIDSVYKTESIKPLYNLFWWPGVKYLQNDFIELIQSVEKGFGDLHLDFTPRLAHHTLKERVFDLKTKTIKLKKGFNLVAFPSSRFTSSDLFEHIKPLQSIFYIPDDSNKFILVTEKDESIPIEENRGYLLTVSEETSFSYLA